MTNAHNHCSRREGCINEVFKACLCVRETVSALLMGFSPGRGLEYSTSSGDGRCKQAVPKALIYTRGGLAYASGWDPSCGCHTGEEHLQQPPRLGLDEAPRRLLAQEALDHVLVG